MENIISKIKYISRNMMLGHNEVMKKFDIKKIGFGKLPILQMIVECPGIHADDIAKTLELDKATIALSLKKLISLGLIVKKQDEHDKRKKKLFPTKRMIGISNEVKTYTDMTTHAREESYNRMVNQAIELGADAIIGMRFMTSMIMQGASEMLAYGTAVKLK